MAEPVLVDSNIILDVMTTDAEWADWSTQRLAGITMDSVLVINPIISRKFPSDMPASRN